MNCVFRDQHIIATQDLAFAGVAKVSARVASAAIPFGKPRTPIKEGSWPLQIVLHKFIRVEVTNVSVNRSPRL